METTFKQAFDSLTLEQQAYIRGTFGCSRIDVGEMLFLAFDKFGITQMQHWDIPEGFRAVVYSDICRNYGKYGRKIAIYDFETLEDIYKEIEQI